MWDLAEADVCLVADRFKRDRGEQQGWPVGHLRVGAGDPIGIGGGIMVPDHFRGGRDGLEDDFLIHGVVAPFHLIEPFAAGLQIEFVNDRVGAGAIPFVQQLRISPGLPDQITRGVEDTVENEFRELTYGRVPLTDFA